MRENKRYLLVRGKNPRQNIEKAILEFIGILGFSKVGLSWVKSEKDTVIISVNREAVDSVRASLAVYSEKMTVEKISGTFVRNTRSSPNMKNLFLLCGFSEI